jgi:hypothetical protein
MNRQVPCLLAVLHLVEWVVVHLLRLDEVIEEHLPQGGHLVVVVHIPGGLLLVSKPNHLLHALPSLLGWQSDASSWRSACPSTM